MLCTLICFMVLHSLVVRQLFYTHLTIHLVLKPIHYIQNQSSFIFMVCLSSRNSSNIIRLVNLSIFQVIHLNDNSLFCVLVNLDIRCSPNSLFMSYIWPVLVRQLYNNLEYALRKFPWSILRIVTTKPNLVMSSSCKIRSRA